MTIRMHFRKSLLGLAAIFLFAATSRADIYQWEWVNPSDHSQGKQQSTTLCPGGAGVSAAPYAFLSRRDLTQAYLIGANLHGATAGSSIFTNADLSGADLTGARISYFDLLPFYSNLTMANLNNANLTGAIFNSATLTNANFSGATVRKRVFPSRT